MFGYVVVSCRVGGLHSNLCVRHTMADAFFRGYKLVIVKDGAEAFTQEDQDQGLKYLGNVYNAEIENVRKSPNSQRNAKICSRQ